ncbi:hypothetical protein Lcho_0951 [Leptothrix cholodnii SP-6]|uniref:Uncharacterized protein n=1 Tax=Leptothrix cholodnii (strain ATCC 51168 / LMG 8142 / SP-6) TaxID=395495 RepID=B1Y2K7_LEPCP|nr:hypothetical protein [Leptothrix cholodnii]ACB33223.1 hypothetical protein Lcho_0951 [Leptothrix cholodnii SP-6]
MSNHQNVTAVLSTETKTLITDLSVITSATPSKLARFILESCNDDLRAVCEELGKYGEGSPQHRAFNKALNQTKYAQLKQLYPLQDAYQAEIARLNQEAAELVAELEV